MKKEEDSLEVAVSVVVMVLLAPFFAWWSGFVMWKIYGWFLADIPGLQR